MIGIETTAAVHTFFLLFFSTTATTPHFTTQCQLSFFFLGTVYVRVCVVLKKMVFIWGERKRDGRERGRERASEKYRINTRTRAEEKNK